MIARITMFATALTLGSALVAKEPHPQAATQIAVPYGDLDLTTARDRRKLDSRIQAAAQALCPVDPTVYASVQYSSARTCVAHVRARAAQRVAEITTAAELASNDDRQLASR